ncbi:alpha/beta hydrolase [Jannaschia sp. Os4]|uniref:alpha/beta fold hydrolase n=1 Tax=Jannaschia sp. Os4 TaxID=2807617 RepID=UPI00193AA684|nr:alpha/beta hydrolase [Jannaschia sp. Os4]MBM2576668.1 alpha/beta hydrolase [Jannaschia sp. Os4]
MLSVLPAAATLAVSAGSASWIDRRARAREVRAEAEHPPEGAIIDVDGIPVHAVVRGEGPDLVLIHGASGNLRDFTFSLVPRLAKRWRVIAFDRPGMGYTGRTDPAYDDPAGTRAETPSEQARLLRDAAARLGATRPVVLGHSFGGTIALAWATDAPDTVAALVPLAAASNRWEGGLGRLYAITSSAVGGALAVPALTAFVTDERLVDYCRNVFAPDPMPAGYPEHVGPALTLRRRSLRANARQVNPLLPHVIALEARYPSLPMPIEVVHGDIDPICPFDTHALALSRMAPTAKLTTLRGVGHMPHHVAPEAVEAALERAAARAGLR